MCQAFWFYFHFISADILNTFVKYLLEYNLFILDRPAKHILCFITRNRNLSLRSKWDQVKNDSEWEKFQNEIVVHSCWFSIYCWFSETYRNPSKRVTKEICEIWNIHSLFSGTSFSFVYGNSNSINFRRLYIFYFSGSIKYTIGNSLIIYSETLW